MYLTNEPGYSYLAIDIETDDLNATKLWCACVEDIDTGETWELIGPNDTRSFIEARRRRTKWVGHNIIGFDRPTLNRLLSLSIPVSDLIDTLVLSYLYHPGMPGGHSLEEYGNRFKQPKEGLDVRFDSFSPGLLARCRSDTSLTVRLLKALRDKMNKVGFSEKSCYLEHFTADIIRRQKINGWYFDIPAAERLLSTLRAEERRLEGVIHETIKPKRKLIRTYDYRERDDGTPYASYLRHLDHYEDVVMGTDGTYGVFSDLPFNIGSPSQRVERLLDLGWQPTQFTKPSKTHPKGQPQADELGVLQFAKDSGLDEPRLIAEWLVHNGRGNMVNTWLNNVDYHDSRMHGSVFSCAAATRRATHSGPNTANVPSGEARYGHECRSLWTVEPGTTRCVVGYDAKSAQMRGFGHYLNNPVAAELYIHGDPHQVNADAIGYTRANAKKSFYTFILGGGAERLGVDVGRDAAFGRHIKKVLFAVTPGLRQLVKEGEEEWQQTGGWIECIDGGWVRCPAKHMTLAYKVQPAEAVMMKQAMILIDQRASHLDHLKIGDIHDEGQHESAIGDAEALGEIQVQAIRDAGEELNFRVPMDGNYKIGKSWAETH